MHMINTQIFKKYSSLTVLVLLELALLLIISYQLQVSRRLKVLERATLFFTGPVQELTNNVVESMSESLRAKKTQAELVKDSQQLAAVQQKLTQLQTQLAESELENARLRELVNLPPEQGWTKVPAQVIGKSQRRNDYMITINKGTKHGLRPDMGVMSQAGVAGVIWEASTGYAKVMTTNNPSSVVAALVASSRYQESFVIGEKLLIGKLESFPNFEHMKAGELILTSGHGGVYPKGLHIGRAVSASPSSYLFQEVRLRFATDFSRLEEVVVLVPNCEEGPP